MVAWICPCCCFGYRGDIVVPVWGWLVLKSIAMRKVADVMMGEGEELLESPERMMGESSSVMAWYISVCMSWICVVCGYSWYSFGSGVRIVSIACQKNALILMSSVFVSRDCQWNRCLSRLSMGRDDSLRYVLNGEGWWSYMVRME